MLCRDAFSLQLFKLGTKLYMSLFKYQPLPKRLQSNIIDFLGFYGEIFGISAKKQKLKN